MTKSGVLSEKDVVIIQRSSGDDPFFASNTDVLFEIWKSEKDVVIILRSSGDDTFFASNTDVLFEIWKSEKDVTSFLDGYLN